MANIVLTVVNHNSHIRDAEMDKRMVLRTFANYLEGIAGGANRCDSWERLAGAVAATGTITLSAASGAVGATINGTLVTVTASGGDTATAAALAAAINAAAAIVSEHVLATSLAGVVTLTARALGHAGNAVTLVASGTGSSVSGARLTGGSATRTSFTR